MFVALRRALPWRNPHLEPGARLGRYRILRRLAVGGMAELFLARVEAIRGFERLVAIKRILPEFTGDEQLVRMFLDEARVMSTLDHPNITHVYDVGQGRGSYYFAMEYVHGENLAVLVRAAQAQRLLVPWEHAAGIVAEAASGLHAAHEQRASDGTPLEIVHRDVSPSNVLVSYDGAVKVADFGVARWARQQSRTRHGALKGKFSYMSPEQCRGEPLDRRSDVFALGVVLYELTTSTRLFDGATDFAILQQITQARVPRPSQRRQGYPTELEEIVLRALAPDPSARYSTARELQQAIEAFAYDARWQTTPAARARFMGSVFSGKLTAWQKAADAGRTLGDYLAELPEEGRTLADEEEGAAPRVNSIPDAIVPRMRTRRAGAVVVAGAAVIAAIVAVAAGRSTSALPSADPRPALTPVPVAPSQPDRPPLPAEPMPSFADAEAAATIHPARAAVKRSRPARRLATTSRANTTGWNPDSVILPP